MNKRIEEFVEAIKENASKVWNEPDDKEFLNSMLFIQTHADGSTTISDNYERFFDIIYRITPDGEWSYRRMWSESSAWKPYSFAQAMGDASIMYTG